MAHDVFISHSAKDKVTADAVCARLEADNIRCWTAPRDIYPGLDWGEAIVTAIEGCRLMVLVLSANANASVQIKREVERAVHNGKVIIPFRIEDVMPSKSLEYFISTPHWLDALTPPLDRHIAHLSETVKILLDGTGIVDSALISAHTAPPKAQERMRRLISWKSGMLLCSIFLLIVGPSLYRHYFVAGVPVTVTPGPVPEKDPARESAASPLGTAALPAGLTHVSWSKLLDKARLLRQQGNISAALSTYSRYETLFQNKYPSTKQYIKTVQSFTLQFENLGVRGGVYIYELAPGGLADDIGLTVGDVITGYSGFKVQSTRSFVESWSKLVPGADVRIDYMRMGETGQFEKKHVSLPHGILGIQIMDF